MPWTVRCSAPAHCPIRFRPPGNRPPAGAPLDAWPDGWRENYLASIQLMRCDEPLASRFYTVPAGKADPHPPGVSIDRPTEAEAILLDWVRAR